MWYFFVEDSSWTYLVSYVKYYRHLKLWGFTVCDKLANFRTCIQSSFSQILNNLLTPWSRVLLEKLTDSATSQGIPRIFGTQRFLTILTSACHLSLSRANSIQSTQLPPTSWRTILILSSHLCVGLLWQVVTNYQINSTNNIDFACSCK